jgi:prepilin-type N-terminal cleavage/methylation domain-containing protein
MSDNRHGFTLVELLLVMGIIAILASLTTISLIRPQTSSAINTSLTSLTADIKHTQLRAMAGDALGESTQQKHGIYFEQDAYTIFAGDAYSETNPSNFKIDLAGGTVFSNIDFPSSQILFLSLSGEVENYSDSQNSITITHPSSEDSKTILINKYGAITIN